MISNSWPMWLNGTITALSALIGLWWLYHALRRDRSRGQPRCPKCWYSLVGLDGQRCPECGRQFTHPKQLFRTRRHYRQALLAIIIILGIPSYALNSLINWNSPIPRWVKIEEGSWAGFNYQLFQMSDGLLGPSELIISKQGKTSFTFSGYHIYLGDIDDHTSNKIGLGQDITGNKIPDVIIGEFTGGLHCCNNYTIIELSDPIRTIAYIDTVDGTASFQDIDGDNLPEISITDDTFNYWKTCYVSSPFPRVILRYQGRRYALAPELMYTPPPTLEQFEQQIAFIRADAHRLPASAEDESTAAELWSYMLDLIYGGQWELALEYYDRCWPDDHPGKEEFLVQFYEQLQISPYWPEIALMNGVAINANPAELAELLRTIDNPINQTQIVSELQSE